MGVEVQMLAAARRRSGRPRSARASVSSALPYIGDESKRSIPEAMAASTKGRRSSWVSKVRQVPIPTTGTVSAVLPSCLRSTLGSRLLSPVAFQVVYHRERVVQRSHGVRANVVLTLPGGVELVAQSGGPGLGDTPPGNRSEKRLARG